MNGNSVIWTAVIWKGTLLTLTISLVLLLAGQAPGCSASASSTETNSAKAFIKAGHWKRARALVYPRYLSDPNDAELNFLMSEIDEAFGDLVEARPLASRAVELRGNESRYHRQLADVDGEMAARAALFAKPGWAKKFKAEAETAAALDARNLDPRFDLLEYDLEAPGFMGGDKDKAAQMADEIGRIDAAAGDRAQARLAEDRKDPAAEENWHLKALEAKPRDYEVLLDLGNFYDDLPQPKFDLAVKYARLAIRDDPGRAAAYSLLASALASQSLWKDLEAVLAEAERNVPDDLAPYYAAARAIFTRSSPATSGAGNPDLARAERYLRKYASVQPEGEAPTLADAHWRLGLVLEKEGRKAEAAQELRTALTLDPSLDSAKKDLKRVERAAN